MAIVDDVGSVVGRISPSPEGDDLRMAIAAKADHVIVAFHKPITWVALTPAEANNIANELLQKSNMVANGKGK